MKEKKYQQPVAPELKQAVKEAAAQGRITCAQLRSLAEELGCTYQEIGQAADEQGIKVHSCELGCF